MPRKTRLTWHAALTAYETHLLARRASPRTLDGRRREVEHLRAHLDPLRPDQVRLTDLREYQVGLLTGEAAQRGKPLAASTVAKVTTAFRAFFGFLHDEGLLAEDPSARLERPKVPQRLPGDVLTVKEIKRLLGACVVASPLGLRDRALLELLYGTGVRRAEVCALDLADLDHREREVRVHHGKGGKSRVVPLTRSAYQNVCEYLELGRAGLVTDHPDSTRALFLSQWGQRIKREGVQRAIKAAARRAKLKKNVSAHTLRRSFATALLKNGTSLRHLQVLLGHSRLDTLAAYLRLDADELRREVLLRHPRERFEV